MIEYEDADMDVRWIDFRDEYAIHFKDSGKVIFLSHFELDRLLDWVEATDEH